jgi:hypothetical protein
MLDLNSPTSGDRSVGIVRLRTKGHGVCFLFVFLLHKDWNTNLEYLFSFLDTDCYQSLIQCVPRPFPWGAKRPGLETDHSPSSGAEVKNDWPILSLPHISLWHDFLIKHRQNFTCFHLYRLLNLAIYCCCHYRHSIVSWIWNSWWNENWQEKPKYPEKTYRQENLVHHESHTTWPGIEYYISIIDLSFNSK